MALVKDYDVENLFPLDEDHIYDFADFHLFGLGGNFLKGRKILGEGPSGRGGKVWSTLDQYGKLYQNVKGKKGPSLFVSHVSPGKEPILTRLMTHFKPNFWLSGHMGAPYSCDWNQFTVREEGEVRDWLDRALQFEEFELTEAGKIALDLIQHPLPDPKCWFKQMWNINLPDVVDGYALINLTEGRFSLETVSRGLALKY